MLDSDENYSNLIKNLKKAIKEAGFTYSKLAKKMEMSESGVKKIFNGTDCSFNRFIEVCNIIDVDPIELTKTPEITDNGYFKLSNTQEEFLINNWNYFCFYWKLAFERCQIKEIQDEFHLSDKDIIQYLKKLSEYKLLQFQSKTKISLPNLPKSKWIGEGELIMKFTTLWSKRTVASLIKEFDQSKNPFGIYNLPMSRNTFKEQNEKFHLILKETLEDSLYDIETKKNDIKSYSSLFLFTPRGFIRPNDFRSEV